jgi:manganese/zinc/iron transport system permease protein
VGGLIGALPLAYTDAVVVLGAAVLGLTSGVLGVFAVLRGRSLVGDGVAHAALPGVCVAFLVSGAKDVPTLLLGAGVAGVLGALAMLGIERAGRIPTDSAIGVVLSAFFSLGVVLLTYIAGLGDADQAGLETYLFGQAAGLLESDVVVMTGIAAVALTAVAATARAMRATLFDPRFAGSIGLPVRALETVSTVLLVVAVVIGVRMVGAILMVAMLVAPAVTARQLTDRLVPLLVIAGVVGAAVGVTGAVGSTAAALPTGPVVVLVAVTVVLTAVLLAPGRGVLWRAGRLLRQRRAAARDAGLLALHRGDAQVPPRTLRTLTRRGLAEPGPAGPRLTPVGRAALAGLLERRRLWSAWLEHGTRFELPGAREPAGPGDLAETLGPERVAALRRLMAGVR